MARDFLAYWKPSTLEAELRIGGLLNHAASNQYRRVDAGDTVWLVSVLDGRLRLIGRIIVGQVVDTDGETHRYAGGHYLTVTGYTDNGQTVTITDPADRKGDNVYQLPIDQMADWMHTRGYTS